MNIERDHEMSEALRKELQIYEEKNACVFQVMGALKLLNIKVKSFVKRLEKVDPHDEKKQMELNKAFVYLNQEMKHFKKEYHMLKEHDILISSVETFTRNIDMLFTKGMEGEYTIVEMRKISVYIYRMIEVLLNDLQKWKHENDAIIHQIQMKHGKYYFNRS